MDLNEDVVFNYIVWAVIVGSASFFVILQFWGVKAQYGRFYTQSTGTNPISGLGPVPGRLAWVCQELPALLVPLAVISRFNPPSVSTSVLFGCFVFHYLNRTLLFPFLIRGGKPSAGHVMLTAFFLQLANGYIQARAHTGILAPPEGWHTTIQFRAGISLFFFGMGLNIWSDQILRNLRRQTGDSTYRVPTAGLFAYVTSANYFGELLQWAGYALACDSWAGFSFFFMTACNLIPRALQHHAWYVDSFGADALGSRKAIIPLVL